VLKEEEDEKETKRAATARHTHDNDNDDGNDDGFCAEMEGSRHLCGAHGACCARLVLARRRSVPLWD